MVPFNFRTPRHILMGVPPGVSTKSRLLNVQARVTQVASDVNRVLT